MNPQAILSLLDLEKKSAVAASLAIAFIPVSISLSHICLAFAFLLYTLFLLRKASALFPQIRSYVSHRPWSCLRWGKILFLFAPFSRQNKLPPPLLTGLLLYGFLWLSALVNALRSPKPFWLFLQEGLANELGDVFLLFFAILVWHLSRTRRRRYFPVICYGFFGCIVFILLSGFLVPVLGDYFPQDDKLRFQIADLAFHRTRGFMNLSLTYAGMLVLIFPVLLAFLAYACRTKNKSKILFFGSGSLCVLFLLWFNNSHSAILSTAVILPLCAYLAGRDLLCSSRKILSFCLLSALVLLTTLSSIWVSWKILHNQQEENSLLFQSGDAIQDPRTLLWAQSGQIIQERPLFGTGAGQYKHYLQEQWKSYKKAYPASTILSDSVPRGHAHQDLLHLAAIGGLPAAFLFLILIYQIMRGAISRKTLRKEAELEHAWSPYLFCGCLALFIGGLAQCYFLDDEVVILFWLSIALAYSQTKLPAFSFPHVRRIKKIPSLLLKPLIWERLTFFFISLSIVSMAFSISFTYINMGLSFFSWLLLQMVKKFSGTSMTPILQEDSQPKAAIPKVFLIAFLFFAYTFFTQVLGLFSMEDIGEAWTKLFDDTEIILMLFGYLVWLSAGQKRHVDRLLGTWRLFVLCLLASGLAGSFMEVQLGDWIMQKVAQYSSSNPHQSHLFDIASVSFYSAQGFMSTRLTYAGLLIIVIPYLIGEALHSVRRKMRWRSFVNFCLLLLALALLWLTGVRSAILGLAAACFILACCVFDKARLLAWYQRHKKPLFLASLSLCLCISFAHFVSKGALTQTLLRPVLRISDFGRAYMWKESGELIAQRPFWGVGKFAFESEREKWRQNFLMENPDTWYFSHFIPKGHLHSDLLHLTYVYGVPAAMLFLALLFFSVKAMQRKAGFAQGRSAFFFCACVACFIAGFAQCYFRDDEVALALWIAFALAYRLQSR